MFKLITIPVILQFAMNKASKLINDLIQVGKAPEVNELPPVYSPNDNSFKFVNLLIDDGINPDN